MLNDFDKFMSRFFKTSLPVTDFARKTFYNRRASIFKLTNN